MHALTEKELRSSFVNASLRERKALSLPDGFPDLTWDDLDFLAWRDRTLAGVGYVVAELDGRAVGIMLKQSGTRPRARAQCTWCETVDLPVDVRFYSARRAGDAGRRGDTLGTLVCEGFECSANAHRRPPKRYAGTDADAVRAQRIEGLTERVRRFVAAVLGNDR
ncbi:FBP domain-containing protein [Rhodococcus rhodnii]|uniref:Elongation factor G-binding protein C-terminal treble-clef zinc-finger domain-containing protein n=2 Tax=Rhodococcus rhodnii TaxID=38312 RepID=R7WNJ6_9NOCA|nr:FBP domain-containing protein [Rhodococcus rhodnii]EOM76881.1 hypothetical protein Rrhod_1794 [Rhodococcus rhodnii LMG 5362]TXG89752.1 FBP domain-containing protein [Rhodococcus rhodnii]